MEQCLTENQNGYLIINWSLKRSGRHERVNCITINSSQNKMCSVTKVAEASIRVRH